MRLHPGRDKLITTDEVNRANSVTPSFPKNLFGNIYPAFPNYINYRANQGSSNYTALALSIRFHKTRFDGQMSYTWSHSIDNQSESLAGTFFDFNTLASAQKADYQFISSFTRQFASGQDRGNSDFDQRHNLVFFGTYSVLLVRAGRATPLLAGLESFCTGSDSIRTSVHSLRTRRLHRASSGTFH